MGTLKPGAKYIYERASGVTYAREIGSNDRQIIGYDADALTNPHNKLWADILKTSETNPTLQQALNRVIMLYRLSKDNPL